MKKRNIKALVNKAVREGGYMDMIEKISLFGSYARGEETKKSDIDLLIEFTPRAPIGYFELYDIQEDLRKALGIRVDLLTPDAISPYLINQIVSEAKSIYEK